MAAHYPSRHLTRRLVAIALAGAALTAAWAPEALAAPPVVTITKPLGGTVTNETTPTFLGTGEEAGVVTLSVYRGALPEGELVEAPSTIVFGPGGAWSLGLLEPLSDGVYTAQASETNGSGPGSSLPVSFTILTTAPVVKVDQPHPAPGDTAPSFTGSASDTMPVTIQIHAGGSPAGTLVSTATAAGTGAAWHSSPASPGLAVGHYTAVAVQSSSLTGNPAGHSDPVGFDVSAAPPPAPPAALPAAQVLAAKPASRAPVLLAPFPVVRVAGIALGGGLKLRLLAVQQAPAGALVRVRCRGRGCPPHGARRLTVAGPHGVAPIVFHSFERYLRTGAVIEVFVTKGGALGKYTRLRVRRGRLPERVDLCLDASGNTPIACPAT